MKTVPIDVILCYRRGYSKSDYAIRCKISCLTKQGHKERVISFESKCN